MTQGNTNPASQPVSPPVAPAPRPSQSSNHGHHNDLEKVTTNKSYRSQRSFRSERTAADGTPAYEGGIPPERVASVRSHMSMPVVSLFGGVAPSGLDAEEGLVPVRSREEEFDRELAREEKGPDPWAVKFEAGEQINPKVSNRNSRTKMVVERVESLCLCSCFCARVQPACAQALLS